MYCELPSNFAGAYSLGFEIPTVNIFVVVAMILIVIMLLRIVKH